MLNSGSRGKRSKDGKGILGVAEHFNQQNYLIPTVTGFQVTDISYNPLDDTAANTAGSQTIVISGSGFAPGATVMIGTTVIGSVTWLDANRLTFTSPALSAGVYTIYVTNANGGTGILVQGLTYSGTPTFSVPAGSVGSYYETTAISTSVAATGDSPINYSIVSGSLPSGSTLNSTTGAITGTAPVDGSSTTYTFQVKAGDADFQESYATFTLTINTDVVSFSSPANNTTYTITQNTEMSNVTVTGISAAGYGVLYTTSGLPTGLSMNTSTGIISGTPTVAPATNVSIITATANTTNRSALLYLNWTVNLPGDLFWKYASLLMSANTVPNGNTFNTDTSTFNNEVIVVADTKPSEFHPFKEGYYSNYFDGTGDYLSAPSNTAFQFGTSDFTIECWAYFNSFSGSPSLIDMRNGTANAIAPQIYMVGAGVVTYYVSGAARISGATLNTNTWYHLAIVRLSGVTTLYVNGIVSGTTYTDTNNYILNAPVFGKYSDTAAGYLNGYMSNIRLVKGTALYTAAFTPPTRPLTYVANTSLITCQSNKLIDNSNNNFTITKNGDVTVNPFSPFDGTLTTVTVPDANNYSMYFDGTGDYITAPASVNYAPPTGTSWTIEFWFYCTASGATNQVLYRIGSAAYAPIAIVLNSGSMYIDLSTTGSAWAWSSGAKAVTLNQWNHVALVRNGGTTTSYINGVTSYSASSVTLWNPGTNLGMGAAIDGTTPYTGYISNVRVNNGTAIYTSSFTPSTTPLTAIANTSLLICQANTTIDKSTNAVTITTFGDARPSRNGPFANTTTVTLVGNEGSAYFDGTGDYLSVSNTASLAIGTSSATVEFWIYPTAVDSYRRAISSTNSTFTSGSFCLRYNNTSTFALVAATNTIVASSIPPVNTWSHVAWVGVGGTSQTLYINGVNVGTAGSYNYTEAIQYIGGYYSVGPAEFIVGYMSNVRVVKGTALYTTPFVPTWAPLTPVANTVLLTAQTSMSSNTKVVIDESNLNNLITANGNITVSSVSPFGSTWSLYANGRPQVTTTQTFTGDFTVEGWFYIQSWNGVQGFIIDGRTNSNSNQNLMWYPDKIQNENIGTVLTFSRNIQTETTGTWNHLAMTRSGSNVYMFINGTSLGSNTYGTGTLTFGYLNFLNRWDGAYNTVGYISNFRILNGTALYTSTFTPSINPLVSVANTRLLCFNSASGQDQSTSNATVVINTTSSVSKFSPFSSVTVTPASYSGYFNAVGTTTTYPSINVATSSTFNLYPVDSTVECWFILNAYGNGSNPTAVSTLFCFYGGSAALYYSINVSSAGFLMIVKDGAGAASITSTTSIRLNTWYHFAWVHTAGGTTNKFYLNGVDVTSTFSDPSLAGAFPLNLATPTFYIGGTYYNNTPYTYINPWNGSISNFRIVRGTKVYTGAFTPPTAQLGLSQSSGTNITALGIPANGNSVYFDGTGDYLSVPSNAAFAFDTSDFTIEFWTYPTVNARQDWIDFNNNGPRLLIYYDGTNIVYYSTSARITGSAMTLNTWQHIALVRSSGSTKLYINGNQSGSTYSDSLNFLAQPLSIGKDSAGSTHVTGYISNLRVVKGTALYTANTTPSTTPLTAVANTVLLTCQNSTTPNTRIIIDNSTNSFPISSVGDTVISEIVSPFGNTAALLTCQSTSFADTSNNAFAITVNGNARPVRQNPFTDTVSDASNYSANTFGNSIYFDGTTDYLTVAGATGMAAFGTSNFTVECWVYMTTFAGTPMLCSVGTSWSLRVNTTGFLQWYIGGLNLSQATIPLILNAWNHIAVVRTGTGTNQFVMYINGVPAFTGTKSDNMTATGTLFIGALDNGAGTYWPGYISNFRIIKGQALYTGPFIPSGQPLPTIANTTLLLASTVGPSTADATRNHNIETFGTARRVANNSPYYDTYSAYFDGTGDYLTLPSGNASLQPASSDFTIEAWVYPTAFVANGNPVAAIDVNGSYYAAIRFGYESSGAISLLMSTNGTTWSIQLGSGLGTLTLNTWQHMAVSKSGTSVRVFLNGVQQGSTQTLSSATLMTGTNNWIGYLNAPSAQYVNGYISNWRLTKTALYTTTFTPPTTPLTAIANTSLLTCQSNRFIDNSTNAFAITKAGDVKISAFQPFVSNNTSRFTSVYFPAKTDYLAVRPQPSLITFPGDFTFECWVYPTDTTITSWKIWDARSAGSTAASTIFGLVPLASPVSGSARMEYYNGTSYYGTTTVFYNQWTHLAWVRSGSTLTFYVNGVAGGTATISGTQTGTATAAAPIYIGSKDNGLAGYGTNGYIADFRITNGYARTITVPTAPYDVK